MASSTQFLHSFLPLLPNLRPKYSLHSSLPFLPPKPTVTFPSNPQSLRHFPIVRAALAYSSSSSALSPKLPQISPPEILSGSTRTLATIFALALSLSRVFVNLVQKIPLPGPEHLVAILNLQRNAIRTAGPLFFASMRDRAPGSLNTPLTVVAAGLAKWLDIYSGVLMALLAQFSMEAASDWLNSSAYVSSNEMLYAEFIFNVDAIKHGNGRRGKIGVERGNCFY
ncbi:hypothetical protein K1719_044977 [Acacia pycnantha]|nr:hypothetical protein K1719_044977 [Acacia pycnantha]